MLSNIHRTNREKKTVKKMIELFCKINHKCNELCDDCKYIMNYSFSKLDKCPFGSEKPTCLNCIIHCYQTGQRERVREIMRFSGPKMMLHHPYLAIMHIIDNKIVKNKKLLRKS
jgi:hypothetical protein